MPRLTTPTTNNRRRAPRAPKSDEVRKLEFTVKARGHQIGAMYHVIQQLLRNHPDLQPVQPPLAGQTEIESLRLQLTQARGLLAARQQVQSAPMAGSEDDEEPEDEVDPAANEGPRVKRAKKSYPLHATCTICFEAYDDGEKRAVATQCGHLFCESCLFNQKEYARGPVCCAKCRDPLVKIIPLFFD